MKPLTQLSSSIPGGGGAAEQIWWLSQSLSHTYYIKDFFFTFKDYYFRGTEVNGKINEMLQRFPIYSLLPTMHSFLHQQRPLWDDAFVIIMNVRGHITVTQSSSLH